MDRQKEQDQEAAREQEAPGCTAMDREREHIALRPHICILYSPGPVLSVLAHRMGIWSHPLKNGLIQHTSKINFVFLEKFPVLPEV